jgi:hypothetical protein
VKTYMYLATYSSERNLFRTTAKEKNETHILCHAYFLSKSYSFRGNWAKEMLKFILNFIFNTQPWPPEHNCGLKSLHWLQSTLKLDLCSFTAELYYIYFEAFIKQYSYILCTVSDHLRMSCKRRMWNSVLRCGLHLPLSLLLLLLLLLFKLLWFCYLCACAFFYLSFFVNFYSYFVIGRCAVKLACK